MKMADRLDAVLVQAERVYGPGEYYVSLGSRDVVLGREPSERLHRADSVDALEAHLGEREQTTVPEEADNA